MSTDRSMHKEDIVYKYKGILLSHKKNDVMPHVATWVDLDIMILSEVTQAEKDKYHTILLICLIQKKMMQMNLYTKQKYTHRHRKQTYGYQRGYVGRGINEEFGIDINTLLCIKEITYKDIWYTTGNYTQYFVIT